MQRRRSLSATSAKKATRSDQLSLFDSSATPPKGGNTGLDGDLPRQTPSSPLDPTRKEPLAGQAYLTVREVAARFGCSVPTVWRHARDAGSPFPSPIKIFPGTTRWALVDLIAYEASLSWDGNANTGDEGSE